MPESLLRILNGGLLALMLLFFLRVLRASWVQVNAPPLAPPAAPAPAAAVSAPTDPLRLRVLEPTDQRGRIYELPDEVTVGRAPGCGVSLPDVSVSQLHARVFRRDGRLYVEDLGSTNGTWLNRTRVGSAVPLNRGDRVQVGSTILEVAR